MKPSERQKQTEAVNIRTDELWRSGGMHKYEVMPRGFPNKFQTTERFYSLPNNKSTPGYTVQCVLSYVEVNDTNGNWCLIN